ncbi:MAG: tRNA pseudouridine(55) synthase [Lachnospiraceae bacterium]|nr:tRNA pseudouridine(55) synthase [Lachnospiraceae bacterium]
MDGIINVYKEKGYTSHDVVAKMRGILQMKKIGHTGTLDPEAEGVLPVCIGKGTKLCDMLADKTKEYRAVLLLGRETDTQDATGRTVAERPVEWQSMEKNLPAAGSAGIPGGMEEGIRRVILSFKGPYMQVPPMYSALKVNGRKLYELARAGKEIERLPRPVEILEIEVEKISLPRVEVRVVCSKGTYIRTLCHDIGQRLGCGGCMESLLRTRVGHFMLADSLRLEEIEGLKASGRIREYVQPVDKVFAGLPKLVMAAGKEGDKLVHNGNPFLPGLAEGQETFPRARVYDSQGEFIGIYGYDERKKRYQPQKLFLGGS